MLRQRERAARWLSVVQDAPRRGTDELAIDAVELSVAAEPGFERRLEQVAAAARAVHRFKEAIDAQTVSVIDERHPHLSLERARQVTRAHS